jgi:hypothetical protein
MSKNNTKLRTTLFFLLALSPFVSWSQGRIVLSDDPYLVLANGSAGTPVFVVVDNSNANAIATLGTGGNVVSENEYNKIRWRINNQTGNYTVPFTTQNDVKIPFSMAITGAGVGGTHIDFSTYPTNAENLIYPQGVTNMTDPGTGIVDYSYWIMDRFWLIDADNYSTRPSSTLIFNYDPNELPAPNISVAGNLAAQRYNTSTNIWSGSSASFGTDNLVDTRVESAVVPSPQLFALWSLIDVITPLPVELLHFSATCDENYVLLSWSTQSELNNSHFEIEKSLNGIDWNIIETVTGNGTTSQLNNYLYRDYHPSNSITYYRLTQVDWNGEKRTYDIQSIEACSNDDDDIWIYNQLNGQYQININSIHGETVTADIYDLNGKKLRNSRILELGKGENVFLFNENNLSTGMYMVTLNGAYTQFTYKLIIQK